MEHLDDRSPVPASGELDGRQPRQPVVTVKKRVAAVGPALERLHAVDESGELGHDVDRRHRPLRAGLDVHHRAPGPSGTTFGNAGSLAAREDVDVETQPTEVPRHFPDVDVHAARLLAAEGREGTGVHGDQSRSAADACSAARHRRRGGFAQALEDREQRDRVGAGPARRGLAAHDGVEVIEHQAVGIRSAGRRSLRAGRSGDGA